MGKTVNNLTVSGYSTALFASYYLVEELGILFDAGDGVSAGLLQKTGKVNSVFLSHADRDHLTGLLQLLQLNGRAGLPKLYFPKDCSSFPYLAEFTERFDPHVPPASWFPIDNQEEVPVKDDLVVEAIRNGHVKAPEGMIKSLSYKVHREKRKLKAAYINLPGKEIGQLRTTLGEDASPTGFEQPSLDTPGIRL